MRIVGLLLLVLGMITLTALLLGDAPPLITDYFTTDDLKVMAPFLLGLGVLVTVLTRGEG